MDKKIESLIRDNAGIRLDIGGGQYPQPGFVNMDYREMPGVDIAWDVLKFPWPLPDNCVTLAMASHLLEHLIPTEPDPRLSDLIELLEKKGVLTSKEIADAIGEVRPGPLFIRFMDEVWRIMKPGGQFMFVVPYAGSQGYWQDPTHINPISERTILYFDPLSIDEGLLYRFYAPKPWKIQKRTWADGGNLEVLLEKRLEDPSYTKEPESANRYTK